MQKRSIYSYDRKKLYEEIWNEPMYIVAKRYEISDRALKKVCDKLQIPTPYVGYWAKAKMKTRKKVSVPPLPDYKGPLNLNIKFEINPLFIELEHSISKYDEEHNFDKLKEEALDWQLAMYIRDYIKAVEFRILTMKMPQGQKNHIRKKIAWAKEKADWLDPITARIDPLLGTKRWKRFFFDE